MMNQTLTGLFQEKLNRPWSGSVKEMRGSGHWLPQIWLLIRALLGQVSQLRAEVARLEAALELERAKRYGRSSERQSPPPEPVEAPPEPGIDEPPGQRKRGGQPGHKGSGRHIPAHLPRQEQFHDLPVEDRNCAQCGLPYQETTLTEDAEELEIKVEVIVVRHRRKRYRRRCGCGGATFITAPPPVKLIPKGKFSTQTWVKFLLDKYQAHLPVTRQIELLKPLGVSLSKGTIHGGFKKLYAYLLPLYEHFLSHLRTASHLHADETRWLVFEEVAGKANHRWWLWVFASAEVVAFVVDPSRSAKVPQKTLGTPVPDDHPSDPDQPLTLIDDQAYAISPTLQTISADRYRVYPAISPSIQIAFCWSHQRRDFVDFQKAQRSQPHLVAWAQRWLDDIAQLYALNKARLAVRDLPQPFQAAQDDLAQAMQTFKDHAFNPDPDLISAQLKLLQSLQRHWHGLALFLDQPDIPMDNNQAERLLRQPVLGRKNYYGNQNQWAGQFSAIMFTLIQTCLRHQLNPFDFLLAYFNACALHQAAPDDLTPFSPWLHNSSE